MKKIVLLMVALFSGIIYAQEITFGAKAGINLASVKGDYEDLDYVNKLEGILGFHAGGFINYAFDDKMALQAELLGSLQGGNIVYEEIPNPITGELIKAEGEVRLPYLQLPVMFQYKPLPKFYVEAGPQMNVLLKLDFKAIVNGKELSDEEAEFISNRLDNTRTFDLGMNIGAGYEFIDKFTVYTRYTHGLITVDARKDNRRDLKNRVVQFGVAYRFN